MGLLPTFKASTQVPDLTRAASFWNVPKEDKPSIYHKMSYITFRNGPPCPDEMARFTAHTGDSAPCCKITEAKVLAVFCIEVRS